MDEREYELEPNGDGGDDDGADEEASDLDDESVAAYIIDEIARALAAHDRAARGSVQRVLPLGEMLALFNLADQFGLIDRVRTGVDRLVGKNAYLTFSEAMKAALLDQGFGPTPPGGPGPRPSPQRGGPPQGRPNRPPGGGGARGSGRQGRGPGGPTRGGGSRPPGRGDRA